MRKSVFLSGLLLGAVLLSACSSSDSSAPAPESMAAAPDSVVVPTESVADETAGESVAAESEGLRVFTVEELAEYDGKDGQPAYVAVSGMVYDVTDVPQWAGGEHAGGSLSAGQDLTEEITNESPHGLSVLDGLTVVGTLE